MKKIIGLIFASLIVAVGLSADSFAQTDARSRSINSREARQQKRIYQGIRSGELTARETYRLEKQQANIRRAEARYRNSGDEFTRRERSTIQRRLNDSSRNIYRQKHDRQDYQYPRKRL